MLPDFLLDIFVRRCNNVSPIEAYDNGCRVDEPTSLPGVV